MILTGKAKEDFNKWLESDEDNLCGLDLFELNNTCINALIIEWFDSAGHIGEDTIVQMLIDFLISCRNTSEATQTAIEKANEIYNNLNK